MIFTEGADIEAELSNTDFDSSVLNSARILMIKSHYVTDSSTGFESAFGRRKRFEEQMLRWRDSSILTDWLFEDDSAWYRRATALMTSRCSLQYPIDRYISLPRPGRPNFPNHVRQFLWNQVKNSEKCCCDSRYFCSSSTNLDKCEGKCCRKCQENYDVNDSVDDGSIDDDDECTDEDDEIKDEEEDDCSRID